MRRIALVDIDAFFVSVERVLNPDLIGRPVVVGGLPDGRGVVTAASYEARKKGVRSAMPSARARALCPEAIFVPPSRDRYSRASKRFIALLRDFVPLVEPVSIDEAYLDLTGCEKLYGPPIEALTVLRNRIASEIRLDVSAGLASTRAVAKIASGLAKPSGILEVLPGCEDRFLAPLGIRRIPGVGAVAGKKLELLGYRTIGDLARGDEEQIERALGRCGLSLQKLALGMGRDLVGERGGPKSVSRETTFAVDVFDRGRLEAIVHAFSEQVAGRLRRHDIRAKTVSVKVRYPDFETRVRSFTFEEPTDLEVKIFPAARLLLGKLFRPRQGVRLVGVAASGLMKGGWQLRLFDSFDYARYASLYRSVDRIRVRYGFDSIGSAGAERHS